MGICEIIPWRQMYLLQFDKWIIAGRVISVHLVGVRRDLLARFFTLCIRSIIFGQFLIFIRLISKQIVDVLWI